MIVAGLLMLLVAGGFLIMALKPRATWETLSAWQYRNPEAVEPSDASYGVSSVVCGISAVVFAILGIVLLTLESSEDRSAREAEQEATCAEVASAIATVPEWRDGTIVNKNEVRERARELEVSVEFDQLRTSEFISVSAERDGDEFGFLVSEFGGATC